MALNISKLSNSLLIIHDGNTRLATFDSASNVIKFHSTVKIGSDTLVGATLSNAVAGVGQSYKIARSAAPVSLDGSNPTSVAHGLTTCVAAFAQLIGSSAPGDSTMLLTAVINGANIDVYAWKHTDGTDPTLVASTGTETFSWFAIGV